jgi:predicted amidohydrolase
MTTGSQANGDGRDVQVRIALAQVNADQQPAKNIAAAGRLARQAAAGGAGLLVLPEMFMARPTADSPPAQLVAADGGRFRDALAQIAADNEIFVVAGGWEGSTHPGRAFNTLFTFSPRGQLVAAYRKLHLFDALSIRESDILVPGAALPPVIDLGGIRVGFAICYDLRFPELFRCLAAQGVALVIVAAAWYQGAMKEDHWLTLLRARAIENTCYVAGCNLVGPAFCGRSTLFDPFGVPLAGAGEAPALIFGQVSAGRVAAVREKLPALAHRRRDLLGPGG